MTLTTPQKVFFVGVCEGVTTPLCLVERRGAKFLQEVVTPSTRRAIYVRILRLKFRWQA
jgi:hypothetical protein